MRQCPFTSWDRRLGYVCSEHRPHEQQSARALGERACATGQPCITPPNLSEHDARAWQAGYDEQSRRIGG